MDTNKVCHQEWMNRPDDQRYLSLADLKAAVTQRHHESWTATPAVKDLHLLAQEKGIMVDLYDPTMGQRRQIEPTHWGFAQLAAYAQAPASYLRTLPSELAAINLQWGLDYRPQREEALILGQTNGDNYLRAMTSTSYGRIWDKQVV